MFRLFKINQLIKIILIGLITGLCNGLLERAEE